MPWKLRVSATSDALDLPGLHPLAAARLAALGIATVEAAEAFLNPDAYETADPYLLPDMAAAVERLWRALKFEEKVLIWGDFDADGQTASALLKRGLDGLGFHAAVHIPKRHGEGHGMYLPKVKEWISRGVQLILTCDTGITAHEAIAHARQAGVDVIVTDHHELADTLPEALAVVSTMRLPPDHPLRDLPGVGIAWKLIEAMENSPPLDLAPLAALGILGDVAVLRRDTRWLAQVGLAQMRVTAVPGLTALIERAGVNPLTLTESDVGFALVPRLNAQGRLGDAADSVTLLTTEDTARAAELANQLEAVNQRRRLETRQIEQSALDMLEQMPELHKYAVLVLHRQEWDGGIIGIVANRLADRFHKPVVLLGGTVGQTAGSARSVPGVHITEALKRLPPEMLASFGGHAMAAGMRLAEGIEVAEFRRALSVIVREMRGGDEAEPALEYDAELTLAEITPDLVDGLNALAPFGNGNPPFVFVVRDLKIQSSRHLDRGHEHLELIVGDAAGRSMHVLWWGAGETPLPDGLFDLACAPRMNAYKGKTELVLEYIDWALHEGVSLTPGGEPAAPSYAVIDWRTKQDRPRDLLEEARRAYSSAQVWSEGIPVEGSARRDQLRPNKTLIVYCEPADATTWRTVIERAQPSRVIFIRRRLPPPTTNEMISALTRICQRVASSEARRIGLEMLAALCYTSIAVVREGLHVMSHMGLPFRVEVKADSVKVEANTDPMPHITSLDTLAALMAEVEAYRTWWREQGR
jgi:single-stranded-DNA-specific exonuclease